LFYYFTLKVGPPVVLSHFPSATSNFNSAN